MNMTHQEILAIEFESIDLGRMTFKGYLVALLKAVWEEGEGFSGKRPFGFSGWRDDLYQPLVAHRLVDGEFDKDGYLAKCDNAAADKLVSELITSL